MKLLLLAALGALVLGTVVAEPTPAGNGIVMMIHGSVEPRADLAPVLMPGSSYPFPPPVPEAVLATNDEGEIHLQVIPYSLAARPVIVGNPRLVLTAPDGRTLEAAPNTDPATRRECREETSIVTAQGDFSGPLASCLAFRFQAETFQTMPVVTLALHFLAPPGAPGAGAPAVETYNVVAHGQIHEHHQGGAPLDFADAMLTPPTPFVFETAVDTAR